MPDFYFISAVIMTAFIWFETQAVPEYLSLFHFKFHKYEEWKKQQMGLDYSNFLLAFHNNFLVRLVTCPYCMIVWFNLAGLFIIDDWKLFGPNVLLSWLGYMGFRRAMKKLSDE